MFTTAGVTRSSIGASEGIGAAELGAGAAATALAGKAALAADCIRTEAGLGSAAVGVSQRAATPPPRAASSRQEIAVSGRMGWFLDRSGTVPTRLANEADRTISKQFREKNFFPRGPSKYLPRQRFFPPGALFQAVDRSGVGGYF
jgi:hypothetical protein